MPNTLQWIGLLLGFIGVPVIILQKRSENKKENEILNLE